MIIILIKCFRLFRGGVSDIPWAKHIFGILSVGVFGILVNLVIDFRFLFGLFDYFIELYVFSLCVLTIAVLYAFVVSQIYPITFNLVSDTFKKMSYKKSTLQNINFEELSYRLEKLMNQDKVYLDGDISLNALAEKLNIKSHQLSELLNNNLNKSFFAYINHYRIQAAKVQLLAEKDTAIIKIAFGCGFNSLSVFNTMFKKETGETPSEFRKKNSRN
ncbi:AraC family transcriptional regulator [Leptospira sp. FAT2]|uniref:helix-turn-helix domain-containing protein n=1 Tax=Leptospira sanjuanensis TaxID=2879643 RepID=UPI001EE838E8|nr:AraC family transcriptional regulator [Leptospira sanjuanensis]MCG6192324.1 AraC family transcriptional regulator [Leptospira sanjuanensis]